MPTEPLRDELISTGDLNLHVVQWGDSGTPIVCVHGLTGNAFFYQALADALSPRHRVFAYDLRGRGDSDKPESGYGVPTHAADLAKLVNALGLERPAIMGHSLGAFISLYYAAHYPESISKLVLIDGGLPLPWSTVEEQPAWLTAAVNRLGTPVPSFEQFIQALKQAPFLGKYWNEYIDIAYAHDVNYHADGSVTAKCSRNAALAENENYDLAAPEQQWAHVQVPTLLLRAGAGLFSDNDQLIPEEYIAPALREFKDVRYVNFPSLNHYTIVFNVEDGPARAIQSFLDEE